jgi:Tol biopolymer transport system component
MSANDQMTPSARAAPSATSKIAFQSNRDGNFEIYVMNADGSAPKRLTNHPDWDVDPSWSPDGSKIVFRSRRDGNWEIYVMNADGSAVTRLTNDPAFDAQPVWSPDGKQIAFSSDRFVNATGTHFWGIYVMNADGSAVRSLITPFSDSAPDWSPDGRKIAFNSIREGAPVYPINDVFVVNVDGSALTRLTDQGGGAPSFSPDGSRIAFGGGHANIYAMNASDGSGLTQLTNEGADGNPSWSRSGQIAFESTRGGGPCCVDGVYNVDIYKMNADGSAVTRLTNNPAYDQGPAWSP